MLLSQDPNQGQYYIRHYSPGAILINDITYPHSLVLSTTTLFDHWAPQNISQLRQEDFIAIAQEAPEVVLLGTGEKQQFPPTTVMLQLITHHIGYEIMDTAAACRTYNILVAEGRRVIAALLIR